MILDHMPSRTAPVTLNGVVERLGVRMTFAKGEEIFGQDEDADLIYTLVKGVVRTVRFLDDGRRQIGDFYYAGDLLGLETGPTHRFCAEALTDCVVLVLKRSALRAADDDRNLASALWEAVRRELERTQDHLFLLSHKSASERVASFLAEVAQRQGGGVASLPMGRQDIADYLGLTIETVSRMITQLQSSGVVEFLSSRSFRIARTNDFDRLAA
jgi:CRP/FNR family nitrogen fixation transcriptional regulator